MPALFDNYVLDGSLARISEATELHICSGTPADRDAVLASSLANAALEAGDFTIADGDVDGRKVTVGAKADVPVTASGTPAHYCLVDGTRLLARTEVHPDSPDLTTGSTTDIPATSFEVGDPAVI